MKMYGSMLYALRGGCIKFPEIFLCNTSMAPYIQDTSACAVHISVSIQLDSWLTTPTSDGDLRHRMIQRDVLTTTNGVLQT